MSETALFADLEALDIGWTLHEHAPVFTVEESAHLHETIAGAHTKNLFLKDAGKQFWLVTVRHDLRVDLKALAGAIGARKLSFGKAEDMEALLRVAPGAVTPLAAINDNEGKVQVVLDSDLARNPCVNVHPLRNTATVGLSGEALQRALGHWGHTPIIAEIPERT
ncbi:DNA-binding protein [Novosphingobium endophyticum]|uniref:DNA-binding protein n=1 Tax=Novosphingobium endophyticum TaxID=1955250 RepID=A0A916TP77_9SPHN|nr:prolyl-tRNA synthetase associated domain-containing protein [Novosphingobium endophyticum]GGB88396.1 DNA-binding protein [Novosphingobium endophyticum]